MICDTLDVVAEQCEVTGSVGLAKHRFELHEADLQELLEQIVERIGAWRLLDLLNPKDIEEYIDPDEKLRNYDLHIGELENQLASGNEKIGELLKRLREQG